jgi:hypothetical protein
VCHCWESLNWADHAVQIKSFPYLLLKLLVEILHLESPRKEVGRRLLIYGSHDSGHDGVSNNILDDKRHKNLEGSDFDGQED